MGELDEESAVEFATIAAASFKVKKTFEEEEVEEEDVEDEEDGEDEENKLGVCGNGNFSITDEGHTFGSGI